jgi:hypothetical protein
MILFHDSLMRSVHCGEERGGSLESRNQEGGATPQQVRLVSQSGLSRVGAQQSKNDLTRGREFPGRILNALVHAYAIFIEVEVVQYAVARWKRPWVPDRKTLLGTLAL